MTLLLLLSNRERSVTLKTIRKRLRCEYHPPKKPSGFSTPPVVEFLHFCTLCGCVCGLLPGWIILHCLLPVCALYVGEGEAGKPQADSLPSTTASVFKRRSALAMRSCFEHPIHIHSALIIIGTPFLSPVSCWTTRVVRPRDRCCCTCGPQSLCLWIRLEQRYRAKPSWHSLLLPQIELYDVQSPSCANMMPSGPQQ